MFILDFLGGAVLCEFVSDAGASNAQAALEGASRGEEFALREHYMDHNMFLPHWRMGTASLSETSVIGTILRHGGRVLRIEYTQN